MIKANELRIGNYVHGAMNELCKVTRLGIDDYPNFVEYKEVGNDYAWGQNGQRPIEITEEWLLRFGFEGDDSAMRKVLPTGDELEMCIESDNDGTFTSVAITKGVAKGVPGKDYQYFYTRDVDWVHELQNLFYALTGKELKIIE